MIRRLCGTGREMNSNLWLGIRGLAIDVWSHRLAAKRLIIGRGKDCEIQLLDQKVSRQHAEIWERAGQVFVRDLNSRNGTFVDEQRIVGDLQVADESLRIGDVAFVIVRPISVQDANIDNATTQNATKYSKTPNAAHLGLAESHCQVLRLLVQGASEKQIAGFLDLTYNTVHSYVKEIYRQLGVHSRSELLARFWSKDQVPLPTPKNRGDRKSRTFHD